MESRWEEIDPRAEARPARRYYQLTPSGAAQARDALARAYRPRRIASLSSPVGQECTMAILRRKQRGQPPLLAAALVRLASAALPVGAIRDRYRREFLADLHGMTARQQARYGLGVLAQCASLRTAVGIAYWRALTEEIDVNLRAHRPVLCRLNVHHSWVTSGTEDGGRYLQCKRCGRDPTQADDGNFGGKDAAAGLVAGLGGSS